MTDTDPLFPFVTRPDEKDTQPLGHGIDENNREYIPATWESGGGPGGSPKVSGGETVPRFGTSAPPRGYNRKDQRYEQPEATLIANRTARAASEQSATVIAQGASLVVEVRSITGNNYDTTNDGKICDCPDYDRLRKSGYTVAVCKHCIMVQTALAAVGGYVNLPWSTSKLAEVLGIAERTAQDLCRTGQVTATKIHNVWIIGYNPAVQAQIDTYRAKMIRQGEWPK